MRLLHRTALLLFVLLGASPVLADDELKVRLSGHFITAPGILRVTIDVPRDEAHRAVTVEANSSGYYRSSVIPLDGASAARRHSVTYPHLPEGAYVIRVTIQGVDGTLAFDEQRARVMGRAPDRAGI